ncbi:HrpE/YscL family type III secretion apparatus protein [Pseudomonas plecoglossicida]|uniref:Type 3 secretion system stator protein n=1 Tax=Pseudomonas plecoglossicida TaxID=70775 RepID=A0AAD0QWA0_PSEDL|nr:HrpE/YscL family type III secretion apparatus protein [Pseudomonas plecoglossicida]AXM95552.1 HrpE/YscL family type III secretion apparatus protein [Pseudomonas plecoglossicida]QLB56299.1 HrpE/YscL family type III secretion apparatus protein [Pseudomonas plecoglossicida]GLR37910.1 type III secretion system protein [Pseudomonas plecoglossicida]
MRAFIEIKTDQLTLAPDAVLLRGADYLAYVRANDLLARARACLEAVEQNAEDTYAEQRTLGYQAGIDEAREQQAALIHETVLQSRSYYRSVEKQMREVVLSAVRKIVHDYDAVELTIKATREALALVGKQENVLIHVLPEQVDSIRRRILSAQHNGAEVDHIEVVANPRLKEGGCILETEVGIVDASIEAQLSALESALRQ